MQSENIPSGNILSPKKAKPVQNPKECKRVESERKTAYKAK